MNINAPPDVLSVLEDGVDRKMRKGSKKTTACVVGLRVRGFRGLGL